MELGKNIYELRKAKNITQEDLAAELGVTAAAVSKWEKGNTLPDVLMVCAIADFFGVTTDELLGRARSLKKLVIMAGDEDRRFVEKLLRDHGFCAAAYADTPEEATARWQEMGAAGVLHIGREQLSEAAREGIKCNIADCVYDEPADLPRNLDTILSMMEGRF